MHLSAPELNSQLFKPKNARASQFGLNAKEHGGLGEGGKKVSPANMSGFKACNCQLHRLRQDVEFVDMSFPHGNFGPGANLCSPRGSKIVEKGFGLLCVCGRHHDKI